MSWEAESWARQQRTGDPVTKAVLVGIANWMNPKGDECQVSMRRLADEVEVSVRTAQRHILRLEEMGLVRKDAVRREDGAQGWNAFTFPTYKPPKVSHVEPAGKRNTPPVILTPPHDKMAGGREGDNLTPPHDNLTGGRVTQLCHGEGDTAVSWEGSDKDNKPPIAPQGAKEPAEKRNRGSRIPADWKPPAINDLPPAAKAKVRQWPAGAYEAEAEAFLNFWLAEASGRASKLDWDKAWCTWINRSTGQILRDARSGVQHSAPAAARLAPVGPPRIHDTSRENAGARKIRDGIRKLLGDQVYDQWIAPSRLDVQGDKLTLVAISAFASNYQRDNFANDIARAMHAVLGPDAELRFHHERPPA